MDLQDLKQQIEAYQPECEQEERQSSYATIHPRLSECFNT